ncbi:MAG: T9SS type A sorting domain-containing protein [Bacteroidaceae bacterium]|nr:T9SS type A sorting domain-containing protein [Bacteroidaceae bacterium]
MKKIFLAAFAALFSLTCLADDYYLNVIANATDSYATASLKKITFENGNVVVTTSNGASTSYAISSISQMYFSSTSAGIGSISTDSNITWDGTTLSLNGLQGKVQVYQPSGALVASESADAERINLSRLSKGVYVVNVNGQSFKIVKK